MFHWKDAYEYRQGGNEIYDASPLSTYTSVQRELCEKKLRELGVDLDDVVRMGREVSPYAKDKLLDNEFEEVLAEFRTCLLLKGDYLE